MAGTILPAKGVPAPRAQREGSGEETLFSSKELESAPPARLCKKMNQKIADLSNAVRKRSSQVLVGRSLKRPIDHKRRSRNQVGGDKAPEPAVPTVLAIITHYKVAMRRDHQFAVCNVVLHV